MGRTELLIRNMKGSGQTIWKVFSSFNVRYPTLSLSSLGFLSLPSSDAEASVQPSLFQDWDSQQLPASKNKLYSL
jgi:hypothetical protein